MALDAYLNELVRDLSISREAAELILGAELSGAPRSSR